MSWGLNKLAHVHSGYEQAQVLCHMSQVKVSQNYPHWWITASSAPVEQLQQVYHWTVEGQQTQLLSRTDFQPQCLVFGYLR